MLRLTISKDATSAPIDLVELQGTLHITNAPPPSPLPSDIAPPPLSFSEDDNNNNGAIADASLCGPSPQLYASLGTITRPATGKSATLHIGTLFVDGEATASKKPILVLKKTPTNSSSSAHRDAQNGDDTNHRKRVRDDDNDTARERTHCHINAKPMLLEDYLKLPVPSTTTSSASSDTQTMNDCLLEEWRQEIDKLSNGYEIMGFVRDHYLFRAKPSRTFS